MLTLLPADTNSKILKSKSACELMPAQADRLLFQHEATVIKPVGMEAEISKVIGDGKMGRVEKITRHSSDVAIFRCPGPQSISTLAEQLSFNIFPTTLEITSLLSMPL
jgi:hypothetical protein